MSEEITSKTLNKIVELFNNAKKRDEFEFCCTLLRVSGVKSAGWDSTEESLNLFTSLMNLVEDDTKDTNMRIRLMLLVYCHLIEMVDFYNVIANIIRIVGGERYSFDPFYSKLYPDNKYAKSPLSKIKRIEELEIKYKMDNTISDALKYMYNRQIRNAFYHSSYTIYNGYFRITNGENVIISNIGTPEIPIESWLMPRITTAINVFFNTFVHLFENINDYKNNKIIKGRLGINGSSVDIELIAQNGLRGFRTPPIKTVKT